MRNKRDKRETVNTTVQWELKELFEKTRSIHNMSFGELLDKSIRELLVGLNQVSMVEEEIARKQSEINKLSFEQSELLILNEKIKNLQVSVQVGTNSNNNNNNGDDNRSEELEKLRLSLFEKSRESIFKLWDRGDINWDAVIPRYKFQDKREALEWFKTKIECLNPDVIRVTP